MTSNFQPDPSIFDDTEGHQLSGGVAGPDYDKVEADVEGHPFKVRVDGPDTDDDTEGHGRWR